MRFFSKTALGRIGQILLAGFLLLSVWSCSKSGPKQKAVVLYKQQAFDWIANLSGPKEKGILTSESYSDSIITALFKLRPNVLSLELSSNSEDSVFILWNESFFIFPNKTASKAHHSHISYEQRLRPLPMEVLVKDYPQYYYVAPKNKVTWNNLEKNWRSFPLMEGSARSMEGEKIRFVLAIHNRGRTLRYPFEFTIEKAVPITLNIKRKGSINTKYSEFPELQNNSSTQDVNPDYPDLKGPKENGGPMSMPQQTDGILEEDIKEGPTVMPGGKAAIEKTFNPNSSPQSENPAALESTGQKATQSANPGNKTQGEQRPQEDNATANGSNAAPAQPVTRSQKGIQNLLEKLEASKKLYNENEGEQTSPAANEQSAESDGPEETITTIPLIDFNEEAAQKEKTPDSQANPDKAPASQSTIGNGAARRSVGSI